MDAQLIFGSEILATFLHQIFNVVIRLRRWWRPAVVINHFCPHDRDVGVSPA
jgi:hypothetical protein